MKKNVPMVVVSCAGKFHAFDVAEQLELRESLNTFYTPYAYQKNVWWRKLAKRIDQENIPIEKIRTLVPLAIGKKLINLPWFWNESFDRWVAWQLQTQKDYKVFIGWSGMSSNSLRVAKNQGKKTILVRSSAHIEIQNELLKEEFARVGQSFSIPDREIKKELEEYRLADYINVPSSFAMNSFLEKGFSKDQLFLNSLGVNLQTFKPVNTDEAIAVDEFKVVFLGSLSLRKGFSYLIEAAQILGQLGKFPKFLFIGGITKEVSMVLKTQKIPFNCHFLGHIPQHQLKEILSGSQLGVIPSIEDGFAQVIPQLLAMGIPVITTPNTGGPEMINDGQNGYIVPIRNAQIIAERIQYLMDDLEQLGQMEANTRASVSNGFSWADYGARDFQFITQITE